jgi:hypothetical protein
VIGVVAAVVVIVRVTDILRRLPLPFLFSFDVNRRIFFNVPRDYRSTETVAIRKAPLVQLLFAAAKTKNRARFVLSQGVDLAAECADGGFNSACCDFDVKRSRAVDL